MGSDPIVEFGFIKSMVEKQLSFYIMFIIYVMANSTNFTYYRKLETNIQDVVKGTAFWLKDSSQKGAPYMLSHSSSSWAWNAMLVTKVTHIE